MKSRHSLRNHKHDYLFIEEFLASENSDRATGITAKAGCFFGIPMLAATRGQDSPEIRKLLEYEALLKRPVKPGRVKSRTGVRFFDAKIDVDRQSSYYVPYDGYSITLTLHISPDTFAQMTAIEPRVSEPQGRVIGHVPGVFAFAKLLVKDDTLFVYIYQSQPYAVLNRLVGNRRNRESFIAKCLAEYEDWSKVMLLAIQDYARYLGNIREICIGDRVFQGRSGVKNWSIPPNDKLLLRLYENVPEELGYTYVRSNQGKYFYVESTDCNSYYAKLVVPLSEKNPQDKDYEAELYFAKNSAIQNLLGGEAEAHRQWREACDPNLFQAASIKEIRQMYGVYEYEKLIQALAERFPEYRISIAEKLAYFLSLFGYTRLFIAKYHGNYMTVLTSLRYGSNRLLEEMFKIASRHHQTRTKYSSYSRFLRYEDQIDEFVSHIEDILAEKRSGQDRKVTILVPGCALAQDILSWIWVLEHRVKPAVKDFDIFDFEFVCMERGSELCSEVRRQLREGFDILSALEEDPVSHAKARDILRMLAEVNSNLEHYRSKTRFVVGEIPNPEFYQLLDRADLVILNWTWINWPLLRIDFSGKRIMGTDVSVYHLRRSIRPENPRAGCFFGIPMMATAVEGVGYEDFGRRLQAKKIPVALEWANLAVKSAKERIREFRLSKNHLSDLVEISLGVIRRESIFGLSRRFKARTLVTTIIDRIPGGLATRFICCGIGFGSVHFATARDIAGRFGEDITVRELLKREVSIKFVQRLLSPAFNLYAPKDRTRLTLEERRIIGITYNCGLMAPRNAAIQQQLQDLGYIPPDVMLTGYVGENTISGLLKLAQSHRIDASPSEIRRLMWLSRRSAFENSNLYAALKGTWRYEFRDEPLYAQLPQYVTNNRHTGRITSEGYANTVASFLFEPDSVDTKTETPALVFARESSDVLIMDERWVEAHQGEPIFNLVGVDEVNGLALDAMSNLNVKDIQAVLTQPIQNVGPESANDNRAGCFFGLPLLGMTEIEKKEAAGLSIPNRLSVNPETRSALYYGELERRVEIVLQRYSNVHRGTGQHSLISTELFEHARDVILDFLGLDKNKYTLIFGDSISLAALTSRIKDKSAFRLLWSNDYGLPLGIGALAVKKRALPRGVPSLTGGGTIRMVSKKSVVWSSAPDKFEAGTPNIVGAITFAVALKLAQYLEDETIFMQKETGVSAEDIMDQDDLWEYHGEELLNKLRERLIGRGVIVPTARGERPYINFDNGASTPTFGPIWDVVKRAWKQPVEILSAIINSSENIVRRFLNAPADDYEVVFVSNTTAGTNIVSQSLKALAEKGKQIVVINSSLEHNSNELPWRYIPGVVLKRLPVDNEGFIDLHLLEIVLEKCSQSDKDQVILVALSGASNVLGSLNDLRAIGRIAHRYGAQILVDAAQLSAHRKVDMLQEDIDYLVMSGHKAYAPFGSGCLMARKGLLDFGDDYLEKLKAYGKENAVGIAALGKSLQLMQRIGMDVIFEYEHNRLTVPALQGLSGIKGVLVYGVSNIDSQRLLRKGPVVVFRLPNIPHNLCGKMIAEEGGAGGRTGCFCANILVKDLLKVGAGCDFVCNLSHSLIPRVKKHFVIGLVRISFGIENSEEEIDYLIRALERVAAHPVSFINRCLAFRYFGTPFMPHTQTERQIKGFVEETVREVYSLGRLSDTRHETVLGDDGAMSGNEGGYVRRGEFNHDPDPRAGCFFGLPLLALTSDNGTSEEAVGSESIQIVRLKLHNDILEHEYLSSVKPQAIINFDAHDDIGAWHRFMLPQNEGTWAWHVLKEGLIQYYVHIPPRLELWPSFVDHRLVWSSPRVWVLKKYWFGRRVIALKGKNLQSALQSLRNIQSVLTVDTDAYSLTEPVLDMMGMCERAMDFYHMPQEQFTYASAPLLEFLRSYNIRIHPVIYLSESLGDPLNHRWVNDRVDEAYLASLVEHLKSALVPWVGQVNEPRTQGERELSDNRAPPIFAILRRALAIAFLIAISAIFVFSSKTPVSNPALDNKIEFVRVVPDVTAIERNNLIRDLAERLRAIKIMQQSIAADSLSSQEEQGFTIREKQIISPLTQLIANIARKEGLNVIVIPDSVFSPVVSRYGASMDSVVASNKFFEALNWKSIQYLRRHYPSTPQNRILRVHTHLDAYWDNPFGQVYPQAYYRRGPVKIVVPDSTSLATAIRFNKSEPIDRTVSNWLDARFYNTALVEVMVQDSLIYNFDGPELVDYISARVVPLFKHLLQLRDKDIIILISSHGGDTRLVYGNGKGEVFLGAKTIAVESKLPMLKEDLPWIIEIDYSVLEAKPDVTRVRVFEPPSQKTNPAPDNNSAKNIGMLFGLCFSLPLVMFGLTLGKDPQSGDSSSESLRSVIRVVTVELPLGIHLKPAGEISEAALNAKRILGIDIDISVPEHPLFHVGGNQILAIASLALERGAKVILQASGNRSEVTLNETLDIIERIFKGNTHSAGSQGNERAGCFFGFPLMATTVEDQNVHPDSATDQLSFGQAYARGLSVMVTKEEADEENAIFRNWYGVHRWSIQRVLADNQAVLKKNQGEGFSPLGVYLWQQGNTQGDIWGARRLLLRRFASRDDRPRKKLLELGSGDSRIAWEIANINAGRALDVIATDPWDMQIQGYTRYAQAFGQRSLVAQKSALDNLTVARARADILIYLPDDSIDYILLVNPCVQAVRDLVVLIREYGLSRKLRANGRIVIKADRSLIDKYSRLFGGVLSFVRLKDYNMFGVDLHEASDWRDEIFKGAVHVARKTDARAGCFFGLPLLGASVNNGIQLFACEQCGQDVMELKGLVHRDHCPNCLYSKHLDDTIPGDRASTCYGLLEPIGVDYSGKKGWTVIYRCQKCGAIKRNMAASDDNIDALIALQNPIGITRGLIDSRAGCFCGLPLIAATSAGAGNMWQPVDQLDRKILLNTETGRIRFAGQEPRRDPLVSINFELWSVRHGVTAGNKVRGLHQGAVDLIPINRLTHEGRHLQAPRAAEILWFNIGRKILDGKRVLIVTSTLSRSRETARPFVALVRENLGIDLWVVKEPLADEISFGIWENMTPDQILQYYGEEEYDRITRYTQRDARIRPENGESFLDLLMRRRIFLEKIRDLNPDVAVIFNHGSASSADRVLLGDKMMNDETGQITWGDARMPLNAHPELWVEPVLYLGNGNRAGCFFGLPMVALTKSPEIEMVGQASAFRSALADAEKVIKSGLAILIEGETGTGKEVLARYIHARSNRASGPFVAVDVSMLGEHLILSELFGHVRGAFTGAEKDKKGLIEQADGGTLFLDEIQNLPPAAQ
ncbi:MAG TPA: aminotransferase class V-fold PLP-dependent enzyme, partial [Candidatus Omnitrophota bacterium]|nr:aminotransferase class V-fold PLP-dependent enzyme [Candidatus Omnitrophota bacterium]